MLYIQEYWLLLELKFSLRSLNVAAYRNFETVLMVSHQRGMINSKTAREAQVHRARTYRERARVACV